MACILKLDNTSYYVHIITPKKRAMLKLYKSLKTEASVEHNFPRKEYVSI